MANPNQFPYVPQSEYARISYGQFPGDVWEGDLYNERISRGLIAHVTPVSQVDEILIGANNPTDDVGVYIDGALFSVTAGANAGATALALEALLEASALLASILASVTVDTATLTVTFADDQPHTVTEYSPDATTATVTETVAAVSQQQLRFGYGVAKQATGASINTIKVVKPTSLDDVFAGVLFRTPSSGLPDMMVNALDPDYDVNYLAPGFPYSLGQRDMGIVVEYVGDAPLETDSVYWICSGTDAGKWRVNDGGTSEVVTLTLVTEGGTPGVSQQSTLTMTSVADGNIGFSYDGLPALSITATGNATNDATSLYALWLANASYMAITTSIVDNLDGTLTIVFNDFALHTFADASTGTSAVAENIDVANVAEVPGDLVAFNYDGLADLSIAAATGVEVTDAANLAAQWNASPQYAALGSITDNLDGTLTIEFADFATHTFTDNSGGTSSITEAVDVAAVAATAKLISSASWGKPSNTAGEVPCAYLRLNNP